jgi:hypothetical protein
MNICFTNEKDESFSLGSVSFGILNENDVFDKFNEDLEYASETIFLCTKQEGCKGLSEEIKLMQRQRGGKPYRGDLLEKIDKFGEFAATSKSLKAVIK